MAEITAEELLARYGAGERDFSKLDLNWIELQYASLRGIILTGANLSDARLFRVDLREANLTGAHMTDTILEDVDLSGANLSKAVLQGATVRRSCLTGANFENAIVAESGMDDSCLNSVNFSGAELCEVSFTRCNFRDATVNINELLGYYLTEVYLPNGEIVTNGIQD